MQQHYCLGEIAQYLGAQLRGDAEALITGLGTLQNARAGQLAFLANSRYQDQLALCRAEAVLLKPDQAEGYTGNCLIVDDPYLGYAKLSGWFDRAPVQPDQIHPSAVVHPSAMLRDNVFIGPNVVIGAEVKIGSGCVVEANSSIADRSSLGADCRIHANVSIYHDVIVSDRVTVHSGTVIGADGFGFAADSHGNWQKIHQLGGVRIGHDVEIGACSTLDRGALDDTVIGNGVIIDNHVQIAHNAVVGDNTAMAAYSALAGSTTLGKNCTLAGAALVVGHVNICDNVMITATSLVTKDITEAGSYSSGATPLMSTVDWRKNSVRIGQLNQMAKRLKNLEQEND